jgi:hypothetical protein
MFAWWWSEQNRLRCLRKNPGVVCLVAFAGKTISVQSAFLHQGERVGDKSKLVLRNRQAASVSFHCDFSFQAACESAGK